MASLTVTKKVKIIPSRHQHKENKRVCRTVVQQLVSSIPHSVLMSTSFKQKEQEIGKQRKTVTFENPDQKWGEIENNSEQESLSGKEDVKESCSINEQNRKREICPGCRTLKKMNRKRTGRIRYISGSLDG